MKVVGSFDDAMSGWIRRLARAPASAADRWNFTSDTLSSLRLCFRLCYFVRESGCEVLRECVCLSVCLSVCLPARISPEPHARSLPNFFVLAAYVRGSVLLRHVYDRPHRLSPGRDFLPHWQCTITRSLQKGLPITSCSTSDHSVAAAFAENGIGREGGDGSV